MKLNNKVTVLMPVYNGDRYLNEAIDSILSQTYKNFDFLIINDGSTDKSEEIIKSYNDSRIVYIKNEHNIGIVRTLNKGLDLIKGEYIVRMDADDISLKKRIEKQVNFMDKNPNIAVSGTAIKVFNVNGKIRIAKVRNNSIQIKTQLLFECALMHPTVIIRRKVIAERNYRYYEEHKAVEDHGLWQKISFDYDVGNISNVLLKYRINDSSITAIANKNIENQDLSHMKIYEQTFNQLEMEIHDDDLRRFRRYLTRRIFDNKDDLMEISRILKLMKSAIKIKGYDLMTFEKLACRYFRANCLKKDMSVSESVRIHKYYFEEVFIYNLAEKIKYAVKRYLR